MRFFQVQLSFLSDRFAAGLLITCLAVPAAAAADQDALARAKELYVTAAYDEALAALDAVPRDGQPVEVAEYRVFCLLALDRRDDARRVIESIVRANPFYHLPEDQASPRIQTVFRDMRRQVFPSVVQRAYAEARAAFERHDPDAPAKFDRVLALLDDPDARAVSALADLKTVAAGFRDLSRAAAAPPPAPAAPEPVATAGSGTPDPPQAMAPAPAAPSPTDARNQAPAATAVPAITDAPSDGPMAASIVPPVAIYQPVPSWVSTSAADRGQEYRGTLELLIDRNGRVTSVKLRKSVHARYDEELLRAARDWRFRPATKEGVPTPYVKVVDVQLIPK